MNQNHLEKRQKLIGHLKAYSEPDNIKLGCLLRIADATEKMAENHIQLSANRDLYKKWYEKEKIEVSHLQSVISGLRGTITKMKKGKNDLLLPHLRKTNGSI